MSDLQQALLDPTKVFSKPSEVLAKNNWTREEKIHVLRRWEYDARELEVAEEENMADVDSSGSLLDEILDALHQLDAWHDEHDVSSDKQGGGE